MKLISPRGHSSLRRHQCNNCIESAAVQCGMWSTIFQEIRSNWSPAVAPTTAASTSSLSGRSDGGKQSVPRDKAGNGGKVIRPTTSLRLLFVVRPSSSHFESRRGNGSVGGLMRHPRSVVVIRRSVEMDVCDRTRAEGINLTPLFQMCKFPS